MKDKLSSRDRERLVMELASMIDKKCEYGQKIERLCDVEKVFYFVYTLEAEVSSGGFGSFFRHSYGEYTKETQSALEVIGAEKTRKLFKQAVRKFPFCFVPLNYDLRQIIADYLENRRAWDALDDKFYEEEYAEEMLNVQYSYIIRNKEKFIESISWQLGDLMQHRTVPR